MVLVRFRVDTKTTKVYVASDDTEFELLSDAEEYEKTIRKKK